MKVNKYVILCMMLAISVQGYALTPKADGVVSIYNKSDVPAAFWVYLNTGGGDGSTWSGVIQPGQAGGFAYKKGWTIKEVTIGFYKPGTVMQNNQPPASTAFLYGIRQNSAFYPGNTLPNDGNKTPLGISISTMSTDFTDMPTALYIYGTHVDASGKTIDQTSVVTAADGKLYPASYFAWWSQDIDVKTIDTVAKAQDPKSPVHGFVSLYMNKLNGTKYDLVKFPAPTSAA